MNYASHWGQDLKETNWLRLFDYLDAPAFFHSKTPWRNAWIAAPLNPAIKPL